MIYLDYINYVLKKCKKTLKFYLLLQVCLTLLAMITSFLAIYLMKYSGGYKAGVIIGFLDLFPLIGNGLYMVYQVMYNLFNGNVAISSNLAVLYLVMLTTRLILEPIFLGRKVKFKFAIYFVISFVLFLIAGPKGTSVSALIVFILNTLINLNDIYTFDRKMKMKARKEKRMREREHKHLNE